MSDWSDHVFDRGPIGDVLTARGWDANEIAAVQAHLADTYDKEDPGENADNLRLARESCPAEVAAYQQVCDHGCCGYHDEVVTVTRTDGQTSRIKIGYNMGH